MSAPAVTQPPLLVVVVNYRTHGLTLDCLRTLEAEVPTLPGMAVVVADNCSPDDSLARLREEGERRGWTGPGGWLEVIGTERNGGFAYGNNRAIEAGVRRFGRPRHVLHLNSDTLVHPGCLAACVRIMDADTTIGAMSCRVLNGDGSMQNVTRRFPTPLRLAACSLGLPWRAPRLFGWADPDDPRWDRQTTARDVDWLGGAFLLMRGELLERIGGFDERFFFYGEDIELCHRIWRSGYRCRYEPGPGIVHLGGSSSDPTRLAAKARQTHHWDARYLVQRLCYGRLAAAVVKAVDTASASARLALLRMSGRRDSTRYAQIAGELRVLRGR